MATRSQHPTDTTAPNGDTAGRLRQEALALFLAKGYAATSVREVATAAGVTIPALYYHYDSKEGLLTALVEQLVLDGEAVIDELGNGGEAVDTASALAAYYDVVVAHLDVFRLVIADPSVRSHPDAGHRLADQGSRFLHLLVGQDASRADLIRASAALGAIRRPLRTGIVDIAADRAQILASAQAALDAHAPS